MGYTNTTTHYELPQYVATDKPKYLTDFNETMVAIDTQMYTNAQAAATADGKAVAAKDVADGAVSSIGTLNAQINGDPTDPSDTGLAGAVSGIDTELNTVQSLIGDGHPTTSNQTIIGAINRLEAAVAPREDGDNLANSYAEGAQFARGGSVYEALTSLTAGTAFASLTLNTDYKVSDTLVEQISYINAEINTLSGDIENKVMYKNLGSREDLTLESTDTIAELKTKVAAAINALIATLEATDVLNIKGLRLAGFAYMKPESPDILHPSDSYSFYTGSGITATATKLDLFTCALGSSPRISKTEITFSDNSVSGSNYDSTELLTGLGISAASIDYDIYTTI